jgi:hypothetical protein
VDKGKAPLEESSKKVRVDKSLELLSLVLSIKSSSATVTFGEPHTSDVVLNLSPSRDVVPL